MTNFERTLFLLQKSLNKRLTDVHTRIWVQGNNRPGLTTILFTIFRKDGSYTMKFIDIKNFRLFKQESPNLEEEMRLLEVHIGGFKSILKDFIVYE